MRDSRRASLSKPNRGALPITTARERPLIALPAGRSALAKGKRASEFTGDKSSKPLQSFDRWREDGQPMQDGHALTPRERELAVRNVPTGELANRA
jgi:hypothetical protein